MAASASISPSDPTDDLKQKAWTSLQLMPFVPMGFGLQILALGEVQRQQANKIDALEKAVAAKDIKIEALEKKVIDDAVTKDARINLLEKDITVKDGKIETLENKIKAIERVNQQRAASRRATVMYLQSLKFPLKNQEAVTAFYQRTYTLRLDDFEGHLTAYAATITAILNGEPLTNWYQPPPMAVPLVYPYSVLGTSVATSSSIAYVPAPVPVASYQTPGYNCNGYKSTTTPINCVSYNNPISCEICRELNTRNSPPQDLSGIDNELAQSQNIVRQLKERLKILHPKDKEIIIVVHRVKDNDSELEIVHEKVKLEKFIGQCIQQLCQEKNAEFRDVKWKIGAKQTKLHNLTQKMKGRKQETQSRRPKARTTRYRISSKRLKSCVTSYKS